ncbi:MULTISPECIES: hypothetical protein [Photorhabdus]|uniref:hypothetical protein n=1 Tax=Photorhabdus TaxID=29487 RepID=UPI0011BDE6E0|nr:MULTISPECIES: hypothetical protein [Photorhabdus]MCC8383308.1 hypothetical protein [Photorhabdus laumondii]MCC8387275.1 hypothetical protein [Photorhabdus laumondii]MCC8413015.1 hypothetical protein [Photorhabdus laumondii]NDL15949.1 hypothetical protein [Photorhabdus laumondii subsp. laumondii]NDL47719.1 hypothetical protein [Photorhabdus laumondii subsp. laumondii]
MGIRSSPYNSYELTYTTGTTPVSQVGYGGFEPHLHGATQLPIRRYFDVDIKNFALGINHGLPVIVNMITLSIACEALGL